MPPAARVSDMTACPMVDPGPKPHVGGPIIPPCSTNVIVCGMPQARVGDKSQCVGPTATIIRGSATVLVNNKQAARMGDQTSHGGTIITGCPTVLIGDAAIVVPPVVAPAVPSPVCAALQQELDQLNDAAINARLSAAAYDDPQTNDNLPDGIHRATPAELETLGLVDPAAGTDITRLDGEDFRADVFVSTDPATGENNYTIAYRGTSSGKDWGANVAQGTGFESTYYNQAARVARMANQMAPGRVKLTGHSLGGGLASAGSAATGVEATTFNAAGLHPDTAERMGGQEANIQAWHNSSDPLSAIQDHGTWVAPSAVGNRRPLPPTTVWTAEERATMESYVDSDNWTPDWLERKRGEALALKEQQMRFHSMEEMEVIIQNDIERVKEEQKSNGCP